MAVWLSALVALSTGSPGLSGHSESGPRTVELAFSPAAGSELRKHFAVELELEVDELTFLYNGHDLGGLLAASAPGFAITSRLEVTDEYGPVLEGRPLELVRWYDDIATAWGWSEKRDVLHPLLYRAVVFTWDADEQAYDAEWRRPSRRGRELLGRLYEDLDLRRLLPPPELASAVEVGDCWDAPFRRLAPVAMPSGDVHREEHYWSMSGLAAARERSGQGLRSWILDGGLDGQVECELVTIRELDDRTLAEIALDLDWSLWRDLTGALEAWDSPYGYSTFERVFVDLDAQGAGWLVWDTTGGHFESLELDLVLEFRLEIDIDIGYFGSLGKLELAGKFRGRWTAEAGNLDDC